jgi:uridylate kinase
MQTSIEMRAIAEPYIRRRAIRHLEKGRIVILAGGTGLPFITTDTTAAMRGLELGCQAVVKATKVDGVYTDDPFKNPKAKLLRSLSFRQALEDEKIQIIDKAAISLCQENHLPILVYNLYKPGLLAKIARGERIGTIIK